jgi:methylase of polypeptide subunit release factors
LISLSDLDGGQLDRWLESLEERHLADLRFAEVTRALRALSSGYVERRATLTARSPFDGAGKRAAYGLFYGPLHFLTVRAIVQSLPGAQDRITHLADWGCGTGAAGAAWATAISPPPRISAVDVHPWALSEAALTYKAFGLDADVRRGDVLRTRVPPSADALVAGWVVNEVSEQMRKELLPRFLDLARRGARVLIVEPIATSVSPWWPEWSAAFQTAGGRADEWRFRLELPMLLRRLDKAAGMRHDELAARSLWLLK